MQGTFAALGFQPTVTVREDERLTLRLRNCPYRAANIGKRHERLQYSNERH